jgi:C-terminal processing protease CtpA/Prc
MNKTPLALTITFVVGFAVASWIVTPESVEIPETDAPRSSAFDSGAPLEQRISTLEQAVSQERQARQLLQDEVLFLTNELDRMLLIDPVGNDADTEVATASESRESRRADYRRRFTPEGRTELLIEAGFQPGRAEYIVKRESELQMQALQARYEAERDGAPYDYSQRDSSGNALREELGDAEYEQYLEANGRSTNVAVSNVIESSPAQRAGLQVGDEIVRYDGYRVFSMSDLSSQTMQGDPGFNVAVDIMRDGVPMQVVLPRGPVGVSAGRRYSR